MKGNIPKEMPREGREMASFLALVVDATTKTLPSTLSSRELACFRKVCHVRIKTAFRSDTKEFIGIVLFVKTRE